MSKCIELHQNEHFVFAWQEGKSVPSMLFLASLKVLHVWAHLSLGWLNRTSGEQGREKWSLHVCDVSDSRKAGSHSPHGPFCHTSQQTLNCYWQIHGKIFVLTDLCLILS